MTSTRFVLVLVVGALGCSGSSEQPGKQTRDQAEDYYRQGTQLLDGDPVQAIELLTKSLAIIPDAPPALYNRAAAYARVGRDADAVADLERLEAIAPAIGKQLRSQFSAAAGGYVSIAEEEYKAENFREAIKKCDSALAYNSSWSDALVVKGLALQKLGEGEKALECLNKGAEVEPDNYFVYINRAELHHGAGRHQQALVPRGRTGLGSSQATCYPSQHTQDGGMNQGGRHARLGCESHCQ